MRRIVARESRPCLAGTDPGPGVYMLGQECVGVCRSVHACGSARYLCAPLDRLGLSCLLRCFASRDDDRDGGRDRPRWVYPQAVLSVRVHGGCAFERVRGGGEGQELLRSPCTAWLNDRTTAAAASSSSRFGVLFVAFFSYALSASGMTVTRAVIVAGKCLQCFPHIAQPVAAPTSPHLTPPASHAVQRKVLNRFPSAYATIKDRPCAVPLVLCTCLPSRDDRDSGRDRGR